MTHALSWCLLTACLCWLVSLGSRELLRGNSLDVAYDWLASTLLKGQTAVTPEPIQFERDDCSSCISVSQDAAWRITHHLSEWRPLRTNIFNFISARRRSKLSLHGLARCGPSFSAHGAFYSLRLSRYLLLLEAPGPTILHAILARMYFLSLRDMPLSSSLFSP